MRVLFVDDEPNILSGLRRLFHRYSGEWTMRFAGSGVEALKILEEETQDVVVSDMRMPEMNGAELLSRVQKRWPTTIRIILTGQADRDVMLKSLAVTHQYLSKPCDPQVLKETIERAMALNDILTDERVRAVAAGITALPSLPGVVAELLDAVQEADCSLERIGEIVGKDSGMTAQILRLVNSAYFGLKRHIGDPATAVSFLGVSTITALAMSVDLFRVADKQVRQILDIEELWRHSLATGRMAKRILKDRGCEGRIMDDALGAGLLHDCGRLVLAGENPQAYAGAMERAVSEGLPVVITEAEEMGVSHAEIGAYLLGVWGLPAGIVQSVAYHHWPSQGGPPEVGPLAAVHIACALDREYHPRSGSGGLDENYVGSLDLVGELKGWRSLQGEFEKEGGLKHAG